MLLKRWVLGLKNQMTKLLFSFMVLAFVTSCTTIKDTQNKMKIRKQCDGTETNKTLSDLFCKKK